MVIIVRELTVTDSISVSHSHPHEQIAREWLTWLAHENLKIISEHENGKEIEIGWKWIPVDGYCKQNNTICQFHGYMVHGLHWWLTRPKEVAKFNGKPMAELKTPTAKITKYLIEQGFPVIEMSVSGPVQNDTLHKLPNL